VSRIGLKSTVSVGHKSINFKHGLRIDDSRYFCLILIAEAEIEIGQERGQKRKRELSLEADSDSESEVVPDEETEPWTPRKANAKEVDIPPHPDDFARKGKWIALWVQIDPTVSYKHQNLWEHDPYLGYLLPYLREVGWTDRELLCKPKSDTCIYQGPDGVVLGRTLKANTTSRMMAQTKMKTTNMSKGVMSRESRNPPLYPAHHPRRRRRRSPPRRRKPMV
jgi:hypothetical protein